MTTDERFTGAPPPSVGAPRAPSPLTPGRAIPASALQRLDHNRPALGDVHRHSAAPQQGHARERRVA